ncbi:hypothetical protein Pint_05890 [Pistacia integerrima]|uniref:Uncharacterized protein n=1 Tax=Pistacia integerrima TaxID=434235 RepID=A0ACC0Z3A9_9ROSI|nr:hypothetical protein Pint_05890 [Pistacia integerrima]
MTKGDDSVMRKKNKARRKKLNKKESSSKVSARVAAVIAAKKRRKSGTRRQCQGMCFSLPTPDDPFNDRHGKKEFQTKETKKKMPLQADKKAFVKGKSDILKKGTNGKNNVMVDYVERINKKVINLKNEQSKSITSMDNMGLRSPINFGRTEIQLNGKGFANGHQVQASENSDCPSKFLILCLNAIQNALHHEGTYSVEEGKPLFVNSWGIDFWRCYSSETDILETSGSSSTTEQIAWMVSTAADNIARKEKEGFSFSSPFLLFLVPSQEKAAKVRSVCKPLKPLGIHTVSLHPGAALDHQINGLKSCEPEFLVSTPERLLELVSLKAIDISGVSMLGMYRHCATINALCFEACSAKAMLERYAVVDGLQSLGNGGHLSTVNSIRQSISGKPHTVLFSDCLGYASVPAVQNLLTGSVYRLSLNDSISSQSSCIIQSISVFASEEEKLLKGIQVLDHAYANHLSSQPLKVLYVVGKDSKFQKLVSSLNLKGYSISVGSNSIVSKANISLDADNRIRPDISIIDEEQISRAELSEYEVVIIPDFVTSITNYVRILTSMARHTVRGVLHSFLTKDDAPHVGELIEILENCGQTVPEALRDLCLTSPMVES